MDKVYRIKDLTGTKKAGMEEGNTKLVSRANKGLKNIINDSIKKAQEVIGTDNIYKEYVNSNKDYINEKFTINKEVGNIDEAMLLIKQIDFRYIFGLDVLMEETFRCEFVNNEQRISIAFASQEEADEAVEKEIAKYPGKEIGISGYERFGMYVREIVRADKNAEAWVSYNNSKNKYIYMVGNKTNDNYVVTHTFDILDLYQIFCNCEFQLAVQDLCELLDIRIKEFDIIRNKYIANKKLINTCLIKDKFPILHELIENHIPKLERVLNEAIDKIYYHKQNNNNWTISCSMSHLAEKMETGKSTINPIINTFALLGLVQKTSLNDGKYGNWDRNEITNFYITQYDEELFEKAEQLAREMLYNGERVTASCFSYKNCMEKFGEEITNLIFKDKVTKARAS